MRSILDVFSRTWFINVILAVCVAFFGAKSIGVWVEGGDGTKTPQTVAEKTKKWHIKKVTREKMPPETAYGAVTVRNLFSPDRAEFMEEEKTEPEPEPAKEDIRVSGRKIVLYGVIMMDDYRAALISDPKPKSSKRRSMWVKEGDIIGDSTEGVVISSIQKERITLRDGEKMYEVLLYDKDKPRGKVAAQKQTKPTVVTTKPTAVARPPAPGMKPGSKNTAPSKVTTKKSSPPGDDEYKMIDTPFGKIKVRKN
ncbi:MAG: hypothetical protein U9R20_03115 [Thermodesulfobacteriota bacterium]|nr:hypothetical protein [Thermodesulfobacteriota bacterium]